MLSRHIINRHGAIVSSCRTSLVESKNDVSSLGDRTIGIVLVQYHGIDSFQVFHMKTKNLHLLRCNESNVCEKSINRIVACIF